MIPDLFHYWMTGRAVAEYTNATSTNFYDARRRGWATDILQELDLPAGSAAAVAPGTVLGKLLPRCADRVGAEEAVR